MKKVLLVSCDTAAKNAIDKTLTYNGHSVHMASDSFFAWKHLEKTRFDFVMIDMQLNAESGLALYKSIRQVGNNIPIMMIGEGKLDEFLLTDLSTENYDSILKPIKFNELQTKVNSFLAENLVKERMLSFGEIKIDCRQQLLIVRDSLLQLSSLELDLITLLAKRGGRAIHPKKIAGLIGKESMSTFYYVRGLREKLHASGVLDILFIKDQGYALSFAGRRS